MNIYRKPENLIANSIRKLLILSGLIGLFDLIYSWAGSLKFTFIIIAFVVILSIFPNLLSIIFRPFVFRYFRIYPPQHFFITHSKIHIRILDTGYAKVTVKREMIFSKPPTRWELYDLFGGENILQKELFYSTPDAIETTKTNRGKNRLAIFWKPKKRIVPLSPYVHTYNWVTPFNLSEPENHWDVYVSSKIGKVTVIIETKKTIKNVTAFKKPWYLTLDKDKKIIDYASKVEKTGCSSPLKEAQNKIVWRLEDLTYGSVYICVFSYQ